jgi:hypothetical protein
VPLPTDPDGRPLSPAQRRRQDLGLLARFGASGLVLALVGGIATRQSGLVTPPWVVAVACFTGVLLLALGALAVRGYEPPPGRPVALVPRPPTDREAGGLRRVERIVDTGLREVDRFNLRVRPWLIELAESRLRHRGDTDLHHDPDKAHDLLGGSLWQLTQQPLTTAPTRAELAEWIARLEAL